MCDKKWIGCLDMDYYLIVVDEEEVVQSARSVEDGFRFNNVYSRRVRIVQVSNVYATSRNFKTPTFLTLKGAEETFITGRIMHKTEAEDLLRMYRIVPNHRYRILKNSFNVVSSIGDTTILQWENISELYKIVCSGK